ncbi:MAG: transcriptional activator RfaH [Proteobacteria bacterium]|nr:transcriptional activator RfaH [Pseudomonadota bacterium]MDA1132788.1 transcriptional activator RfaH [Pseudomonadota bacterium]
MIRWYCVTTQMRAEVWARNNLWQRGFEAYLPEYSRRRRHARRTDWVRAPLFPRYLFVRADFDLQSARAVTTAPGVQQLIAFGGPPTPVPDAVIAELRAHEGDDGLIDIDRGRGPSSRYRAGERVRVTEGALLDQVGIFQCREDRQRAVILLELLGRAVRVRVAARSLVHEQ